MVVNCALQTYERNFTLSGSSLKIEVEQEALDLTGDLAPASKLCRDGAANERAMEMLNSFSRVHLGEDHGVCYAIEAIGFGHTKVGLTTCPKTRLVHLQQPTFADLRVSGLVWFDDVKQAMVAETHVLRAADEMGIRSRGEWLTTDGAEVVELLLKAARYAGLKCYDSATALRNIGSRVKKLSESKRTYKGMMRPVDEYDLY